MQVPILSQLLSHHAASSASAALKKQTAVKAQDSSSSDSGSSSSSTSAAGSAVITANDFLSLLVTEIQNQDPTTQTDPMEYITQLCDVNSLEQLVQINQNTTPPTTSTTSNSSIASSATATTAHSATSAKSASALLPLGSQSQISGSAAQAVAQSLGRSAPVASQANPSQLPSTHLTVRPEELRAIEMSIPGAALAGGNTPATLIPTSPAGVSGGDIR